MEVKGLAAVDDWGSDEERDGMDSIFAEQIGERTVHGAKRSLGAAVILAAVDDYKNLQGSEHTSAAAFLFPAANDPAMREHLAWAVSDSPGINADWLRENLDRCRPTWDAQRAKRSAGRFATGRSARTARLVGSC